MDEQALSVAIEDIMVARNLRHMKVAQLALRPGYYLRAAKLLRGIKGTIIIGVGFPVGDTFETDGPVGAIALYNGLQSLGAHPVLACAAPLAASLAPDFNLIELKARDLATANQEATTQLALLQPQAIISIERPGLTADGRYYNMRGEDISARSGMFDTFVTQALCPTIAIGDGGNEIGMGNIATAIADLDINASITCCDELLVADVSNWGAYGILALLGKWAGQDLLAAISPPAILEYLSARGSVDGVTRENTPTEDGLDAVHGCELLLQLRALTGFGNS